MCNSKTSSSVRFHSRRILLIAIAFTWLGDNWVKILIAIWLYYVLVIIVMLVSLGYIISFAIYKIGPKNCIFAFLGISALVYLILPSSPKP